MSDDADLEKRAVEALRQYREALVRVVSLEQKEAFARQALTSMLPDFECAILGFDPSIPENLFQAGLAAVARSNEAWGALSEATVTLEATRKALVTLEQQLGYIPGISIARFEDVQHNC